MPWKAVSIMEKRKEFVRLASQEGANVRELCRRIGISWTTAYKWLERYGAAGDEGLTERSRRPHQSPGCTARSVEEEVLAVRKLHPAWGARKLKGFLSAQGVQGVPAVSTIHAILKRNGCIALEESHKHTAWHRFEHDAANDLWQMDFKGHFAMSRGRCHPLTIVDDHSRFAVVVQACANETGQTVRAHLEKSFRQWGLPKRMLTDHGGPWGVDPAHRFTELSIWIMRLGIAICHGRPRHPQTQGKAERFHRTLKAEAITGRHFDGLEHVQRCFDEFRHSYNHERPHEALRMNVPAQHYAMSPRAFEDALPPIEYGPDDLVRKVTDGGWVYFKGKTFRLSAALKGQPVALRPSLDDGVYTIHFCQTRICQLNLNELD